MHFWFLADISGFLSIEDRWKELGLTLGYTRNEINKKFTNLEDPINAILADFMGREGEAEVFHNAMYKVARTFKLIPYDQMMENRENRRIENRVEGKLNDHLIASQHIYV